MIFHAEISHNAPVEEGFGFLAMQAAYKFDVTGKMYYGSNLGIVLTVEGEAGNLDQFLDWLINNTNQQTSMQCYRHLSGYQRFKEFDIYHQP